LQGVDVLADIVIVFLILSAGGSVSWQTFFCFPDFVCLRFGVMADFFLFS